MNSWIILLPNAIVIIVILGSVILQLMDCQFQSTFLTIGIIAVMIAYEISHKHSQDYFIDLIKKISK